MGQPSVNKIVVPPDAPKRSEVNPMLWKEVFEYSTFCYSSYLFPENSQPRCNSCGNKFKQGQRITKLLLITGTEYYHEPKCLKGVEIIGATTD